MRSKTRREAAGVSTLLRKYLRNVFHLGLLLAQKIDRLTIAIVPEGIFFAVIRCVISRSSNRSSEPNELILS
jgi:hypothetical protein